MLVGKSAPRRPHTASREILAKYIVPVTVATPPAKALKAQMSGTWLTPSQTEIACGQACCWATQRQGPHLGCQSLSLCSRNANVVSIDGCGWSDQGRFKVIQLVRLASVKKGRRARVQREAGLILGPRRWQEPASPSSFVRFGLERGSLGQNNTTNF